MDILSIVFEDLCLSSSFGITSSLQKLGMEHLRLNNTCVDSVLALHAFFLGLPVIGFCSTAVVLGSVCL